MKRILLVIFIISLNFLNAASLSSSKNVYQRNENIHIKVTNLEHHSQNWLAIYRQDDSNAWGNVLRWTWTENTTNGDFQFKELPTGKYQARVFYNNSYQEEAIVNFVVGTANNHLKTSVETRKDIYNIYETIQALTQHMSGHPLDWIAIYPKGSSNAWKNVIDWRYLNGTESTIVAFNGLPFGKYEVRVFFKNSYKVEAIHAFQVGGISLPLKPYVIKDNMLFFKYDSKSSSDWIGIYKKGDSVTWSNVLKWKWLKDIENDEAVHISGSGSGPNHIDLFATHLFRDFNQNLPKGKYEARVFRNNSFKIDQAYEFTVK